MGLGGLPVILIPPDDYLVVRAVLPVEALEAAGDRLLEDVRGIAVRKSQTSQTPFL